MFRHQRAGIVTSHVFTVRPTAEQLAPLVKDCNTRHGTGWGMIHEAELLTANEIPAFPEEASSETMPGPVARGVGTVT